MTVTRERVESRLSEHGYQVVEDTGEHRLYEHHGDRIVVPLHSPELSPWSARVIEWSLEPRLGRGWLGTPSQAERERATDLGPAPPTIRLNLVIRPEPDRSAWNAFVAEEPRILTFGPTLAVVRRRAVDAANAWYAGSAVVELETHHQLGADASRWTAQRLDPESSPSQLEEARRQLMLCGFSEQDVDELVPGPTT